jgi:hypothetical protein
MRPFEYVRAADVAGVVGHPKRSRCQSSGRIMEW